ncbi:MAG TPA: YqaA family protein [Bosea sp. (in: a-proteobacteria)]|jgi:membrane protein YqaA with SNARE-associated domain|uniref:YqaA family protein n=1 Tax=Bosea sp. (in: a-proteobacteria) TaxID=1871050 RepID=UPI002E14A2EC|nr:YqaA family protein [Bosea sp. (in: a-proteobacteria)]
MIKRLYEWTMSLAARPRAELWLAIVAFVESSFFLIPADVLYVPMALTRPSRAYRFALVATLFSTLGGILGYAIGYYAFEALARPVLAFYGKLGAFEALRACAGPDTTLLLLTTSGLAHLPPIKVVTILAGAVHIGLGFFVLSCVLARGFRFFALAFLLRRYGATIRHFVERRLKVIAVVAAAVLILLYFGLKLVAGSGQFLSC